jgi:nucleoside-diphosphate-sugar epimerase
MKVLILGVNGFIGHHLTRRILADTDWTVFGLDLSAERLGDSVKHPRFEFVEGTSRSTRVDRVPPKSDVVLPLVATNAESSSVRRFQLDFEENLRIAGRSCATGRGSSTSEVTRPTRSSTRPRARRSDPEGALDLRSKQLLDRVISRTGRAVTPFRPFNWLGPKLDSLETAKEGSSRVATQFIANLVLGTPIQLVDGGSQRRCFTYVDDGIEALMRILANEGGRADGMIFNLGHPGNDCSIRELAELLRGASRHPSVRGRRGPVTDVTAGEYYGRGTRTSRPGRRRSRGPASGSAGSRRSA